MRIAFDAKRYFNNRTGLGNYSRSIVHTLAKRFPEHEFVLIHTENTPPLLDLPNLKTMAFEGKGSLWRVFGMAKDLKKAGITHYHGLSNEIPRGLKKLGIKSVVTLHDAIFMRYPEYYPFFDRIIYKNKTRYAVNNADGVVSTSRATAADLHKYFGLDLQKNRVIYQPINPAFYADFVKTDTNQKPYYIYVSSFTKRKNHGALIQAFARIQKLTDWNLLLVGSGNETLQNIQQFIAHEKLNDRVQILQNASDAMVVEKMQQASGFVYPSLFEGFGIPLAEAAACKLPIAVADIAVFKELAEDAAVYFHPNKYEEMADAMLKIANPEHALKLVQKRDVILNKIQPEIIADQLMQVYLEL